MRVYEIERDRYGVMYSGPLEVGECISVVPATVTDEMVERAAMAYVSGDGIGAEWPELDNFDKARAQMRAALAAALAPTQGDPS